MRVPIRLTLALLTAAGVVLAQTPNGGWRRVGDPTEPVDRSPVDAQQPGPEGTARNDAPPPYGGPAQVTLQPGTYMTVRINQALSSDRSQPGDSFSATLAQPVVADGIVVARRGQMVYGRVAEARKANANHPSRLGLELTSLTLADGTQAPIRSQLVAHQGGSTPGEIQAGTVAGTTAVGAGIGAAAGWGTGAVIGAGAGAAAGLIGVLLTRHHPTVVYPETALTFRVESPVTVATANAQAFRYVTPEDYQQPEYRAEMQPRPVRRAPARVYYYGPAYYPPYPYPYAYYPYPYAYWGPYWGPSFGVFIGGGRGYWGRRWW